MIIQKEEWLPDLTKKNIGHPVQFASQINTAVFVFVGGVCINMYIITQDILHIKNCLLFIENSN